MAATVHRMLLALVAISGTVTLHGQGHVEVAVVDGASVRMSRPANWNGALVLAAGGYAPLPARFSDSDRLPELAQELLEQGYAYAETGYSDGGLAVAAAVLDVRALRRRFIERHGKPQRVYVIGESKGGLVALLLMETAPREFDGALLVSGLLASPFRYLERAYALLDAFHSALPGILPDPRRVPADYSPDETTMRRIADALHGAPGTTARLRALASVRWDAELVELLAFHTDAMRDLQRRCAGNPFAASRTGSPQTSSVTSPAACARTMPAPTGNLQRPVVAVENSYDPIMPRWTTQEYLDQLRRTGRGSFLVRDVLAGEGHLNVSVADRLRNFSRLVAWVTKERAVDR
jgi:pimeloyl-ACP methyl ester carboxylesterase